MERGCRGEVFTGLTFKYHAKVPLLEMFCGLDDFIQSLGFMLFLCRHDSNRRLYCWGRPGRALCGF